MDENNIRNWAKICLIYNLITSHFHQNSLEKNDTLLNFLISILSEAQKKPFLSIEIK